MKFRVPLATAVSLFVAIIIVICVAIISFVTQQQLDRAYTDNIDNIAHDVREDLKDSFERVEQEISLGVKLFTADHGFRQSVVTDNQMAALQNLSRLSRDALPLSPALIYINREDQVAWLTSGYESGQSYDLKSIENLEKSTSLQSKTLVTENLTGELAGEQLPFFIVSEAITEPETLEKIGMLRVVYAFDQGSPILSRLRDLSKTSCLMISVNKTQSSWDGKKPCESELPTRNDLHKSALINDKVIVENKNISAIYPNLSLVGAREVEAFKYQRSHAFWTLIFATAALLLFAVFAALFFIRYSITPLLSFIRKDSSDNSTPAPSSYISEFTEIGKSFSDSQTDALKIHKQLQETNREWSEFTYAISHDIKSPVVTMNMLHAELEETHHELSDESREEIFNGLHETTNRMLSLIDSISTYARSVGGSLAFSQVNLDTLTAEILTEYRADIEKIDAEIIVDSLSTIKAYEPQMKLLLQHLISNALKFINPDVRPKIQISSFSSETLSGAAFHLIVKDNGIGIPEKYQDRIFGLFQRLHNYSTYEGTGIGLSVCQRVALNHNGQIKFESAEGKGTTFTVILPTAATQVLTKDDAKDKTNLFVISSQRYSSLDPHRGLDWLTYTSLNGLCATLVGLADDFSITPDIAQSFHYENEGRTMIFKLYPNRKFHNGIDIRANDVVYSFNRMLNPEIQSPGASYLSAVEGYNDFIQGKTKTISGITAIDELTVRFDLSRPSHSFIYVLATNFACIIPNGYNQKPFDLPISAGPTKAEYYSDDGRLFFSRFQTDPPIYDFPYETMSVHTGLSNLDVTALHTKQEVDLVLDGLAWDALGDRVSDEAIAPNSPSPALTYIALNTQIAPFNNPDVRRAVNYGIDRRKLERLLSQSVSPTSQIIPPAFKEYDSSIPENIFDPAAAAALLKGVELPISVELYAVEDAIYKDIVNSISEDLRRIGIDVIPKYAKHNQIVKIGSNPDQGQMIFSDGLGWFPDYFDISNFYFPLLAPDAIGGTGWNWSAYSNSQIDDLVAQAERLIGVEHEQERQKLWQQIFALILDDAPIVPLYNRTNSRFLNRHKSSRASNAFLQFSIRKYSA